MQELKEDAVVVPVPIEVKKTEEPMSEYQRGIVRYAEYLKLAHLAEMVISEILLTEYRKASFECFKRLVKQAYEKKDAEIEAAKRKAKPQVEDEVATEENTNKEIDNG